MMHQASKAFVLLQEQRKSTNHHTVISKDFRYLVVFVSLDLCNPRLRYRHDVCSLPRTVVAQTCRRLFLLIIPRFDSQLQWSLIVCISSNEANRSGRPSTTLVDFRRPRKSSLFGESDYRYECRLPTPCGRRTKYIVYPVCSSAALQSHCVTLVYRRLQDCTVDLYSLLKHHCCKWQLHLFLTKKNTVIPAQPII